MHSRKEQLIMNINNSKLVVVLLLLCVAALTIEIGATYGELSGLKAKSEMLIKVACKIPDDLKREIDVFVRGIHSESDLGVSYAELRAAYKWPCE
jgi:hypothetical protein